MNTNHKGAVAEAKIIARLAETGEHVLVPFARTGRYDLGLDRKTGFVRVECKRGRIIRGSIVFDTATHGGYGYKPRKSYSEDADYFAVWCPLNDAVYMIPVSSAAKGSMCLRLDPPKKRANTTKVKWAKDFKI